MGEPVMRDWIYRSGDIFLPRRYVDKLDTYLIGDNKSTFYLNYWHFMHLLSGVLFVLVWESKNIYFDFFIAHSLWELWQVLIGMTPLSVRGAVDTTIDTLAGFLGIYLFKSISTMAF